MRFVVDASVTIRWFLREEQHDHAVVVLRQLVAAPERFAVPELFAYEVFAVLVRVHPDPLKVYLNGMIPLLQGGILRYPMTENIARRAQGFYKHGLTGYDACYAALAEELEALWLTFDSKAHEQVQKLEVSMDLNRTLPEAWEDQPV